MVRSWNTMPVNVSTVFAVIGGWDGEHYTSDIIFDPAIGEWNHRRVLVKPTQRHRIVAFDNELYLFGGYRKPTFVAAEVWVHDSFQGSWSRGPDMTQRRQGHGAALLHDEIYVAGGYNYSHPMKSVEVFHRDRGWRPGPSMNIARCMFGLVEFQGQLYAIGGESSRASHPYSVLSSVEVLNRSTNTWELDQCPNMTIARSYFGVAVFEDKLYVAGGYSFFGIIGSVEIFYKGAWSRGPSFPEGRSGFSLVPFNGRLYAFGGYGEVFEEENITTLEICNSVDILHVNNNSWMRGKPMPRVRTHHSVAVMPACPPGYAASDLNVMYPCTPCDMGGVALGYGLSGCTYTYLLYQYCVAFFLCGLHASGLLLLLLLYNRAKFILGERVCRSQYVPWEQTMKEGSRASRIVELISAFYENFFAVSASFKIMHQEHANLKFLSAFSKSSLLEPGFDFTTQYVLAWGLVVVLTLLPFVTGICKHRRLTLAGLDRFWEKSSARTFFCIFTEHVMRILVSAMICKQNDDPGVHPYLVVDESIKCMNLPLSLSGAVGMSLWSLGSLASHRNKVQNGIYNFGFLAVLTQSRMAVGIAAGVFTDICPELTLLVIIFCKLQVLVGNHLHGGPCCFAEINYIRTIGSVLALTAAVIARIFLKESDCAPRWQISTSIYLVALNLGLCFCVCRYSFGKCGMTQAELDQLQPTLDAGAPSLEAACKGDASKEVEMTASFTLVDEEGRAPEEVRADHKEKAAFSNVLQVSGGVAKPSVAGKEEDANEPEVAEISLAQCVLRGLFQRVWQRSTLSSARRSVRISLQTEEQEATSSVSEAGNTADAEGVCPENVEVQPGSEGVEPCEHEEKAARCRS